MRTCPKCGAYYSDVQLAFCLADGTPLADVSPHSEKWSNGSRTIEEKAKRLRNQKRKLMRRWILVGAMTTLTLTMAVANSFTVETTTPRDKPPIPVPSASSSLPVSQSLPESAFWPTPPSPSASPSPSLSVSPSPTLVHKISGRVMSAGQPIGGIKIMLEGSLPTSTTTDANGNYVFSNLRDGGRYTITPGGKMNFMPPSRSFNNLREDGSADFSVPPEVYKISGRVMSAGQPIDGVQIMLTGAKTASTRTNASGNFTFNELQVGGNYTITPGVKMNFTPASRSFNNLRQNEAADFSVPLEAYKISGRVMSATQPLAGVKVRLEGLKLTSVTTDVDGNYTFADLSAGGSYTITPQASTSFKPASRSFDNLRRNEVANFLGSTPPRECSETEKERIGSSLIARFAELWQRNIERERSRIISEAVDVKNAVATLERIEFQPTVTTCSAALVTARYSWQVKADLPQGLKVVNVPKVKRFSCTNLLGGWRCFEF